MTLPSAENACAEALLSMPEYVAERLGRDGGKAEMACVVRGGGVAYKIVVSMRIEDESGMVVDVPLQLADSTRKRVRSGPCQSADRDIGA